MKQGETTNADSGFRASNNNFPSGGGIMRRGKNKMKRCFDGSPKHLRVRGGILLVSGVVLAITLFIVGRGIPNIVISKTKDKLCVDSVSHDGYLKWLGDETNRPSYQQILVYFWNITNQDGILYNGEVPKVKEVGPYVYRFATSKHDVKFNTKTNTVKYKQMMQTGYDSEATLKLCPGCSESDQITTINVFYIGLTQKAKGDTNFALGLIPTAAKLILTLADLITGGRNTTLSKFGQDVSVLTLQYNQFPAGWGPAEFGKWIFMQNTTSVGTLKGILSRNNRTGFTEIEMKALYDMMTNPVQLGPTRNATLLTTCISNPLIKGCGFLLYTKALQGRISSLISSGQGASVSQDSVVKGISANIQQLLCTNSSVSCLIINSELITAISLYITQHLIKLAIHLGIDMNGYGPIITRTQKELASGFVMDRLVIPPTYPNGVPIKGIITNDTSRTTVITNGTFSEFRTCKSPGRSAFQWYRYGDSDKVNPSFFPGASREFLGVKSRSPLVGIATTISPCRAAQKPLKTSYDIFQPMLLQKIRVNYKKDTILNKALLNHFQLDYDHLLDVNNVSVFRKGIIGMEFARKGLPVLVSLPHFYKGDGKLPTRFQMSPTETKHGTFYEFEPITGTPAHLRQAIQINVAMPAISVQCPRQRPFNFSYTEGMRSRYYENIIPLYWLQTYVKQPESRLKSIIGIYSVLDGSCASMVVGPVFGVIQGLLGMICVIRSCSKGRVQSTMSLQGSE